MKNSAIFLAVLFVTASCSGLFPDSGEGTLSVRINLPESVTKASPVGVPETDEFILSLFDSQGSELYHGRFADSPEKFSLPSGNYTVSASSSESEVPAFDFPVFGDEKTVAVASGADISVFLSCFQTNAGVRVDPSDNFVAAFPEAALYMKGPGGGLACGLDEDRYAYFPPGAFGLSLIDESGEKALMSRTLEARQMIRIRLDVSGGTSSGKGITMSVDTSRVWSDESFVLGGGGSLDNPLSVTEALSHIGEKSLWIYGYLVGVCTTSTKLETSAPFSKGTNVVLAARTAFSDRSACICVELPSGRMRDAVNLMDTPSNLGRKIIFRGNVVESYYSMTGLKSVSEFEWL